MTEEALRLGKQAQEYRNTGEYQKAINLVEKLIPLVDKDSYFFLGQIYGFYAQLERDLKNYESAISWYQKSQDIYQQGSHETNVNHVIRHIAEIETTLGRTKEAKANYEKVLGLYRSNTDTQPGELANTVRGYALLLEKVGNKTKAKKCWTEARDLYQKIGLQEGVNECDERVAKL